MDSSGLAGHCSEFGEGNGENMKAELDVFEAQKEFKLYVKYLKEALGPDRATEDLESFAIWFQNEWPRFFKATGTPCFTANRMVKEAKT